MKSSFLLHLVSSLLIATGTQAAVILDEPFAYADGSLVTVSGNFWITHSGTAGQVNVSGGKVVLTQSETEDVSAPLANAPYSSGNLYASFTVNFSALPSGDGGYFAHFKDNGSSGFRAKIYATTNSAASGKFRLGIANVANAVDSVIATDLSPGMPSTVVLRYDVASRITTLWINPELESDTADRADAADPATALSIYTFALRQSLSSGNGMGTLTLDDLKVGTAFEDVIIATNVPPAILAHPHSQTVIAGTNVAFTVTATGSAPLSYQWKFYGTNLPGATQSTLTLTNVSTNQSGPYFVTITNASGATNSQTVTLTVNASTPFPPGALSLLNYNVKGNGVEDWTTNSPQVRAIGRQMAYLNPDVITFQEIPLDHSHEMTNFVNAFLPGYSVARNSGTDGFIRSVIVSRFPITRSQSWLDGIDLRSFGYSNANNSLDNFTRDLFEAQISVPGFAQPLHVFTTHLKSGGTADDASKRAAEANAISNFFVTGFLTTNANRPYVLTGDMNEDINRPPGNSQQPVQRLISAPTGLRLTTPVNPSNGNDRTWSIQAGALSSRLDYILPGGMLFSNIAHSQVFRTDLLNPTPPGLQSTDSATASDHLPVLMVFYDPFDTAFAVTSISVSDQLLTLNWKSSAGRQYRVEASGTLTNWAIFSPDITASGTNTSFSTNVSDAIRFFRVLRLP